jgi:SAM-dependent methyltransferase
MALDNVPGLPLVYALKYMPRRVVSIFGSLLRVLGDWYPTSVLDIGSGTGATALALDLLNLPRHVSLTGLEPSREMILFSESPRYQGRVSSRYTQGSIADLAEGSMSLEPFDLLVFSACLPYGFDDWSPLLATLGDYRGQESKMILAVEPDAKHDLLTSFQRRLTARGWPTATFCCHDLPGVIKQDGPPLREITDVWRRLGLDGSPKTWWNPPDDKFLVANPKPENSCRFGDGPFSRVEALGIGEAVGTQVG